MTSATIMTLMGSSRLRPFFRYSSDGWSGAGVCGPSEGTDGPTHANNDDKREPKIIEKAKCGSLLKMPIKGIGL